MNGGFSSWQYNSLQRKAKGKTMKKKKFNKSDYRHRDAILHMIGQSQDIGIPCRVSTIASWMNVSKPTARNWIKINASRNNLIIETKVWRVLSNGQEITCDEIILHPSMKCFHEISSWKSAYKMYAQEVMGVILQDD